MNTSLGQEPQEVTANSRVHLQDDSVSWLIFHVGKERHDTDDDVLVESLVIHASLGICFKSATLLCRLVESKLDDSSMLSIRAS
ncbi:hypothetical protein ACHAWO_009801 [Cyclotella atomus]|uniref:Uncharacterized protein n=1 Tax=Cyclotella atomus TaxID=382360 RepID=A0ABD3QKD3_9STRA